MNKNENLDAEVPFLSTSSDCDLAKSLHPSARMYRVGLDSSFLPQIAGIPRKWIDLAFDGLDRELTRGSKPWQKFILSFPNHEWVVDRDNWKSANVSQVEPFVFAMMDLAHSYHPVAISIPQVPITADTSRNRLNWALAHAAGNWRAKAGFSGLLILPAIATNQRQLNTKTERNKRIAALKKSYELSGANGTWSADSTLSDQSGEAPLVKRFKGLIAFQEQLNEVTPNVAVRIGGPYWGLNLVLWARNLIDSPAIGMGKAYQYYLSGGIAKSAKTRLALPPLRRWVQCNTQFHKWLDDAMETMAADTTECKELSILKSNYKVLQSKEASRNQIAKFYKSWLTKISESPAPGRALTLYQDLSSAYVLGKTHPALPQVEKTAKRPERIAEQLMLCCL